MNELEETQGDMIKDKDGDDDKNCVVGGVLIQPQQGLNNQRQRQPPCPILPKSLKYFSNMFTINHNNQRPYLPHFANISKITEIFLNYFSPIFLKYVYEES